MDEEIMFFEGAGNSPCYLESLVRCRSLLMDDKELFDKLRVAINLEIDLAVLGAEKAKSEVLKADKDNKVRPIK